MQREVRYRRHTDEQDALLLAWVLILGCSELAISLPGTGCMCARRSSLR